MAFGLVSTFLLDSGHIKSRMTGPSFLPLPTPVGNTPEAPSKHCEWVGGWVGGDRYEAPMSYFSASSVPIFRREQQICRGIRSASLRLLSSQTLFYSSSSKMPKALCEGDRLIQGRPPGATFQGVLRAEGRQSSGLEEHPREEEGIQNGAIGALSGDRRREEEKRPTWA